MYALINFWQETIYAQENLLFWLLLFPSSCLFCLEAYELSLQVKHLPTNFIIPFKIQF